MNAPDFKVKLNLRLDWSEMDLFGHINNVMYMKYIQASRVNYWESISLMKHFESGGIGPILLSTSCLFKKPLHYPGNILVQVRMEFIKNTSFGLHHQILNEENEVCAEAKDIIVMYDFSRNEKVPVSGEMRDVIEKLEEKKF